MHKNFKGIEKTVFGRGSFSQLAEIADEKRNENNHFVLYLVDYYFKGKELEKRIQAGPGDLIVFIDVDPEEPTTAQIDELRDRVKSSKGIPSRTSAYAPASSSARASFMIFSAVSSSRPWTT